MDSAAGRNTWMLVHMELGERKLDFYALQNSFSSRLNPAEHLILRKTHGAVADLLDDASPLRGNAPSSLRAPPVYVTPDATHFLYNTNDEDEPDDFAEHEHGFGEYDFRHPGTNWESDDEEERGDNEIFSAIATKAGQDLGSILFAGEAGEPTCELKPAYKLQLSVRIDEKRQALVYDCFEYKGAALTPSDPLPSNRSMLRFQAAMHLSEPRGGRFGYGYGSDDDDDDDDDEDGDDPSLDEPCEPSRALDEAGRVGLHLQGHIGDFMSSRLLRFRVPLASVSGVRLHSPGVAVDGLADEDARAILVLELHTPPEANAFAARKLGSRHHGDKEFSMVPDWTPRAAATVATRHYISGGATEMRDLAAHLASLSERLARMLELERPSTAPVAAPAANSLAPPASLAVSATPPFHVYSVGMADDDGGMPSLQSLSARAAVDAGASAEGARDAGYPSATVSALAGAETAVASARAADGRLTCERVHELMTTHLGLSAAEAERANPCFKRGVLLGHIVLSEATTRETVVCRDTCICCSTPHEATIEDVLDQPVSARELELSAL